MQKLSSQKPVNTWKLGIVLGLIGTMIEYGLFIALWLFEDWRGEQADINFILFGCFIIGWIAFIVGAIFIHKE